MLGIIIVAVVFSKLAGKYNKSKWGYAILGLVTYYGSMFIYGIIYALILISINPNVTEEEIDSDWTLKLTGIAFGILVAYLLHHFLEKNWKKNRENEQLNIDDIGKDVE